MRAGDERAREQLILQYMPLARGLALRYRRGAEPAEDLIQVACVGLVKAVDRWDPTRGLELSSFATPTILGELRRHFRDTTWGIRPPRGLQELVLAADRERHAVQADTGRPPTLAELAGRLACEESAVSEALQAGGCRSLPSLDAPVRDGDAHVAGELIPLIDRELERTEQRATIERMTRVLDDRSREVLRLRYDEDLMQREIAARTGTSQVHVSRTLRASLKRLQADAA
jgi:RNA polymerase sigma-B factor